MTAQPMVTCTVCKSPHKAALEADLAAGKSELGTSKRYGVTRGALRRHVGNGHVVGVAPKRDRQTIPDGLDIDPVASLQEQLNQLYGVDTQDWSPAQIDRLHEQRRRVAESLSRARPPADLEGPAAAKLKRLEEMVRVQDEVLERHPEVRAEVAAALRAWRDR